MSRPVRDEYRSQGRSKQGAGRRGRLIDLLAVPIEDPAVDVADPAGQLIDGAAAVTPITLAWNRAANLAAICSK